MKEVTHLLRAIKQGELAATDELLPLVYEELRRLAQSRMSHEMPGQTIQPTALVHEAYLRLVDSRDQQVWNSRHHFFAAAAESMRRILVEIARKKKSLKRGGDRFRRLDFENLNIADPDVCEFLHELNESLEVLAEKKPEVAKVVTHRFFAGMTIQETAEVLDISVRTVNRHWDFAKAWLYHRIVEDQDTDAP